MTRSKNRLQGYLESPKQPLRSTMRSDNCRHSRYCDGGLLEIDNNAAEKPCVRSHSASKELPVCWFRLGRRPRRCDLPLIGSARLNDLGPEAYLRDALTRITDHPI